jgi:hypothetical protein
MTSGGRHRRGTRVMRHHGFRPAQAWRAGARSLPRGLRRRGWEKAGEDLIN